MKRLQKGHPEKTAQLMNITVRSRYNLESCREKDKSDSTRDCDKERLYSARRHDVLHGHRKVIKERSFFQDLIARSHCAQHA